jgi:hypothetical protein
MKTSNADTKAQADQIANLKAAMESAKAARDASNTAEHREAYKIAYNAFVSAYAVAPESIAPKMKRGRHASRAGQRQHAELRAAHPTWRPR